MYALLPHSHIHNHSSGPLQSTGNPTELVTRKRLYVAIWTCSRYFWLGAALPRVAVKLKAYPEEAGSSPSVYTSVWPRVVQSDKQMPASVTASICGQGLASRHSLSALTFTPLRPHRIGTHRSKAHLIAVRVDFIISSTHTELCLLAAGYSLRVEAAVASRKERTQKRHKALRNKVRALAIVTDRPTGLTSLVYYLYLCISLLTTG